LFLFVCLFSPISQPGSHDKKKKNRKKRGEKFEWNSPANMGTGKKTAAAAGEWLNASF
jgi:hypothetical protein